MTNQNQWNADDYAKNSSAQLNWAKELIEKLSLIGNETLLDIGCGDGKITAEFASILKNGSVLGIDSSQTMVELARKTFPAVKYPNLEFKLMDATSINLSHSFDVVFSNAVLHWITDHGSVLKGIRNHLKPLGKLLFQIGGKGNARELLLIIDEIITAPDWKEYFIDFTFPYSLS